MHTHALSRAQIQAVRSVMRLLAEDDRSTGIGSSDRRLCARCRRSRPAAGFVSYPEAALCNTCATAYELARLRHRAATATAFLDADPAVRSGPRRFAR